MISVVRVTKGKVSEEAFTVGDVLVVEYKDDVQDGKATRYLELLDGKK